MEFSDRASTAVCAEETQGCRAVGSDICRRSAKVDCAGDAPVSEQIACTQQKCAAAYIQRMHKDARRAGVADAWYFVVHQCAAPCAILCDLRMAAAQTWRMAHDDGADGVA